MASELLVNKITPESGTTLTLGESGDTISFASGVLPSLESLTITGDLTVDTDTLYVDSANNEVGIGTTSPDAKLHIQATAATSGQDLIKLINGADAAELVIDTSANAINFKTGTSDDIVFLPAGTEAMRITSGSDVLIGKTTLEYDSNAGTVLRDDGFISAIRDGGNVTDFNRLTSDGEVVRISKDGTTVGSIGVASSDLNIYGDVGIKFSGDDVRPTDSSGNNSDNAVDLGHFDVRWQDLYLGGNIYLGGTGSANALDDYEEGTWTPTVSLGTVTVVGASYTKVGRLVTISFTLSTFSDTTSTSNINILGLPFTSASGNDFDSAGSVMFRYVDTLGDGLTTFVNDNNSSMSIYMNHTDGNYSAVKYNSLNNASHRFIITHTYQAA